MVRFTVMSATITFAVGLAVPQEGLAQHAPPVATAPQPTPKVKLPSPVRPEHVQDLIKALPRQAPDQTPPSIRIRTPEVVAIGQPDASPSHGAGGIRVTTAPLVARGQAERDGSSSKPIRKTTPTIIAIGAKTGG